MTDVETLAVTLGLAPNVGSVEDAFAEYDETGDYIDETPEAVALRGRVTALREALEAARRRGQRERDAEVTWLESRLGSLTVDSLQARYGAEHLNIENHTRPIYGYAQGVAGFVSEGSTVLAETKRGDVEGHGSSPTVALWRAHERARALAGDKPLDRE